MAALTNTAEKRKHRFFIYPSAQTNAFFLCLHNEQILDLLLLIFCVLEIVQEVVNSFKDIFLLIPFVSEIDNF